MLHQFVCFSRSHEVNSQIAHCFSRSHEVFGDVKKLLTVEFVRQGWLEYQRQPTSEPPTYEYSWGPRANAETSKANILNFVCQVRLGHFGFYKRLF